MGGPGWKNLVRMSLVSLCLVFAIVAAASAQATAQDEMAERLEASRAKFDRSRVTLQERLTAAGERELMRRIAEVGASGATASALVPYGEQGGQPDYFGTTPNWAYSPDLRKFVDTLPGLGPDNANNLGQYIGVAHPDTVTYPGSDYYEIELREYSEQMHSDMPPTRQRGYVQVNNGTDGSGNNTIQPDGIHQLGPIIMARKDRPVRVKFTNKLPTGEGGDLFIPVDTSVMGAGMGPEGGEYTQNRATLHLHGGITPWISDGTPHQWITPAGEDTPYPKGVSVKNVPDMPDPGDGSMTFFYSNQQSARMLWYHDHSYGITRLNVYAGQAAGYLLSDETEDQLVSDGIIPSDQVPLIVMDKTFVDADTVLQTDPTWNWGTGQADANGIRPPVTGDLWLPHVYMPNQNPALLSGINPMGRWHFGSWFWPPIPDSMIHNPPIDNPLYDPVNAPWEYKKIPATPNPSMGMEAFHDTPLVNGTAYPVMEVDPKSYRLRFLNAAGDRFFNFQMYVADETVVTDDGRVNTEVKMVPASITSGFPELWPTDGREGGVPDPATAGPDWVQIGTEGGFLPKPVVIPQQPVTWINDMTPFNAGLVKDHSLLLAPAERADVVVDFSQYAGKTLILYNDCPAPFPALDPRYDYYTGAPDLTEVGGTAGTDPGYGPNTRTIMQIKVADKPAAAPFDLAALEAAFASSDTTEGVFESSQLPIHVPDERYASAYNNLTFPQNQFVGIFQNEHVFKRLDGTTATMPLEPKAIQDETSEVWDFEYGRMAGKLGLEMPRTNAGNANFILYSFFDPVTEHLVDADPLSPVGEDGSQLWKITQNGVDTHPIHFHLFDVQLINRVAWDGEIVPPDDNELGWKETVRVNPLEDTIVALRPAAPKMEFGVPDSVRPLDPTQPIGGTMDFSQLDPITGQQAVPAVQNIMYNFGWEYVWHCHILSHEEMDMMRPMSLRVATAEPDAPVLTAQGAPGDRAPGVELEWTDGTPAGALGTFGNPANEFGFVIERVEIDSGGSVLPGTTVTFDRPANTTTYVDETTWDGRGYRYTVTAKNPAGDVASNAVDVVPAVFFTSHIISTQAGPMGSITPGGPIQVLPAADSPEFTVQAGPTAFIQSVQVGPDADNLTDLPVTPGQTVLTHTFTNVTSDQMIVATFVADDFNVYSFAGAGGSITPAGNNRFLRGSTADFTITPLPGYRVLDVLADGGSVGAVTSHSFPDISADHTVTVTFERVTYTITPSAGPNGSVTPDTAQNVGSGLDAGFTIIPNPGYLIEDVLVDGVSVGAITSYTFRNVKADHTVHATFMPGTFTITPSAGANGSITPSTVQTVNRGASSPTFQITPSAGYHIADVLVDGGSVGPVASHTFTNVTANHTISASFAMDTFTTTITVTGPGSPISRGVRAVIRGILRPPVRVAAAGLLDPRAAGQRVQLLSSTDGKTFKSTGLFTTTDATGAYSFSVAPLSKTWYRVYFAGTANLMPTLSPIQLVEVKAYVRTPISPRTMVANRSYRVYGSMKPRHKAGTSPVRIYKYKYVAGKWVSKGYVKAKLTDFRSYSHYSARVKLDSRGIWRLKAYAVGDSQHAPTWSAKSRYVTVR